MGPDAAPIIVSLGLFGLVAFGIITLGPIGRAFSDRLRGKHKEPALDTAEMEALRDELAGMRRQMDELAERQDFSERLLAQVKERGLLSAPKER